MCAPVRLLLADDKELFRDGLARVLTNYPDIEVVGVARNGLEAVDKARRLRPDVVLLDVTMPGMDGIDAARLITAELPGTRVGMLSASDRDGRLFDAIRAGARGFITKDCTIDELVGAVQRLAEGDAVITPHLAARLLDQFAALSQTRDDPVRTIETHGPKVTERERDILQLLVEGATNKDIAERLAITENTVKVHLRNILEKLHLRNRQQAAAFAVSAGLVRQVVAAGRPKRVA